MPWDGSALAHVTTGDLATASTQNKVLDNIGILKTNIADDGKLAGNIKNFYEDAGSLSISANTLTVDMAVQNVVPFSFNANITTTTINNKPASGKLATLTFVLTADGSARTWAFLTSTVIWPSAGVPTFTTTNGKKDMFTIWTLDGGSTWYGIAVAQNY